MNHAQRAGLVLLLLSSRVAVADELVDAPPMRMPRADFTLTGLPDGRAVAVTYGSPFERFESLALGWSQRDGGASQHIGHSMSRMPDGRVLIAGGALGAGTDSRCWWLDPDTGVEQPAATMAGGSNYHTATVLGADVLIAGGTIPFYGPSEFVMLHSPSDGGRYVASMNVRRTQHQTTLLGDGRVLVTGGASDASSPAAELWSPVSDTWSLSPMPGHRAGHSSTRLGDGRVLVVGGYVAGTPLASVVIFDPVDGGWSVGPPLPAPRYWHAAAALGDGRVLVAGGTGLGGGLHRDVLVFNGVTWADGGVLRSARTLIAAASLPGAVLIAGGQLSDGGVSAESSLYLHADAGPGMGAAGGGGGSSAGAGGGSSAGGGGGSSAGGGGGSTAGGGGGSSAGGGGGSSAGGGGGSSPGGGGSSTPRGGGVPALRVGCGCGSSDWGVYGLLLLALQVFRRASAGRSGSGLAG